MRRSTRHLSLTELGESYLPRCREIVETTEALKRNAASQSKRPSGRLRVSAAGLHARRICDFRTVLVASPAFLHAHGRPETPDDLLNLPCLIDTVPRHGGRWPFLGGKTVKGPVMINDGEIIRDLTIAGLGIAYLPGILVKDDIKRGVLCELLTEVASETHGVYAVFPPRDYINPAARTFAQAIAEAFA